MPATKTIPKAAHDAIESAIDDAVDEKPVVLWWDDGGHLEDTVERAARALDCEFRAAEETPLELRAEAPRERTVWYVPTAKNVDWFKDVENTGGVIEAHIGKLAARCFETDRIQAASLRTAYDEAGADREQIARTLYDELDGEGGLPTVQRLQTRIVLDGHDDAVQFVLEHGADGLPDDGVAKIRDLLVDEGVTPVRGVTDGETLVARTRRWAVAEWLVDEGLDDSLIEDDYRPEPDSGLGVSRPDLRAAVSKTDRPDALADVYLDPDARFWHDILRTHDDPWALADCPVDATLEHRLWETWHDAFAEGDYETCAARATRRHERLNETYGDVVWTRVWDQAVDVSTLASELDTWAEHGGSADIVDLYGDVEDGTWQIDHAVFNLIVSGTPETALPEEHPATATLDDLRTSLTESEYVAYLQNLADLVADQIESGSPFAGTKHANQFFDEEGDRLESGESVALFIVDALRFDLAHELAETVRETLPGLEVDEEPWVGTLPTDTEFGKAALTPGSTFSFNITLDDGDLVPERNGRPITNYRRKKLLREDGWSYIMQSDDTETGWSEDRVAYYWNDLDKTGEEELTNFEEVFSDRLDTVAAIICERIDQGEWDRAYILSDHGFVSLPESVGLDPIRPPASAEKVTRRWVAGADLGDDLPGVRLDDSTHLGYLDEDTEIDILADPLARFRNQGISNSRFYHGGVLPQECVLNFVTITQE